MVLRSFRLFRPNRSRCFADGLVCRQSSPKCAAWSAWRRPSRQCTTPATLWTMTLHPRPHRALRIPYLISQVPANVAIHYRALLYIRRKGRRYQSVANPFRSTNTAASLPGNDLPARGRLTPTACPQTSKSWSLQYLCRMKSAAESPGARTTDILFPRQRHLGREYCGAVATEDDP